MLTPPRTGLLLYFSSAQLDVLVTRWLTSTANTIRITFLLPCSLFVRPGPHQMKSCAGHRVDNPLADMKMSGNQLQGNYVPEKGMKVELSAVEGHRNFVAE